MSADLQTGLLLLGVGMITVFTVLGIVVLVGKSLIALLGRFDLQGPSSGTGKNQIAPTLLAAITAAIHTITQGKGHIEKVERMNK